MVYDISCVGIVYVKRYKSVDEHKQDSTAASTIIVFVVNKAHLINKVQHSCEWIII